MGKVVIIISIFLAKGHVTGVFRCGERDGGVILVFLLRKSWDNSKFDVVLELNLQFSQLFRSQNAEITWLSCSQHRKTPTGCPFHKKLKFFIPTFSSRSLWPFLRFSSKKFRKKVIRKMYDFSVKRLMCVQHIIEFILEMKRKLDFYNFLKNSINLKLFFRTQHSNLSEKVPLKQKWLFHMKFCVMFLNISVGMKSKKINWFVVDGIMRFVLDRPTCHYVP